jgi:hypothetical protein
MLRRMLNPNADLRYTAADALFDTYWKSSDFTPMPPLPLTEQIHPRKSHQCTGRRRADMSNAGRVRPKHTKTPSMVEIISPWATRSVRGREKENGMAGPKEKRLASTVSSPRLDSEKRRSGILAPSQVFQGEALRSFQRTQLLADTLSQHLHWEGPRAKSAHRLLPFNPP